MRKSVLVVLVVVTVVVTLSVLAPVEEPLTDQVEAQLQQDPGGGGDGGGCSYCDQQACGCSSPPPGCILSFSCSCSSIDCSRTCDYQC